MKRLKFTKIILPMMVTSLLFGCGGGSSGGDDSSTNTGGGSGPEPVNLPALKSLSVPEVNFQTIQPSDIELVDSNDVSLDAMAYSNEADDKRMFEVDFQECEECDAPVMPNVTRVFDINQKYIMFNMKDSTVAWNGIVYHGDYPVIMDKQTGRLYPIVIDGKVSEFDYGLQNESPFLSQQKQGDIIPNNMLYSFDITDRTHWHTRGIYKAELKNNAFVFKTLKSDVYADERNIQIDEEGNILAFYQDPPEYEIEESNHYAYISKSDAFQEIDYQDTLQRYEGLRVIDGKLAGIDTANSDYFSFVEPAGNKLESTLSQYLITDSENSRVRYNKRSPQIDGFDMNMSCIVNRLNDSRYDYVGQSSLISIERPYASFDALRASQHTLFCVDYIQSWQEEGVTVKVSAFDTKTQTFYDFDTGIELYNDFHSSDPEGGLKANEGVVVQSDHSVMLYMNRINSDEVVEFYIDPIAKTVAEKVNHGYISPVGFASLSH